MFRVAFVGHSQVPLNYEYRVPEANVRIYVYRKPGARVRDIRLDPQFRSFWNHRFDISFIFIGGNDLEPETNPRAVKDEYIHLLNIVNGKDVACIPTTIERRELPTFHRHFINQAQYNRKSRALNRMLIRYWRRHNQEYLDLQRGVFTGPRAQDGVHFSEELKLKLYDLLDDRIGRRTLFHPTNITSYQTICKYPKLPRRRRRRHHHHHH